MPQPISKYPIPKLEDLPQDIRAKMLEVQQKAGFIPNVFLTLAHRPDEFRAFFASHGAILRVYAKNPQIADQVAIHHRKADITSRQKAMLDFACKLARTPEAMV